MKTLIAFLLCAALPALADTTTGVKPPEQPAGIVVPADGKTYCYFSDGYCIVRPDAYLEMRACINEAPVVIEILRNAVRNKPPVVCAKLEVTEPSKNAPAKPS